MSQNAQRPNEEESFLPYIVILVLIFFALFFPILVISVPLYFLFKRFNFIESISGLIFSSLISLIVSIQYKDLYFKWYINSFKEKRILTDGFPIIFIIPFSLLIVFILLTIKNTRFSSKLPSLTNRKNLPAESPGLMPSLEEKEIAKKIVSIAGRDFTIDNSVHSSNSDIKFPNRQFPIGVNKAKDKVYISESELRYHGIIFGSTGSGKTEIIKSIAGGLLDLGWHGMMLDLKEDTAPGGLKDWCEDYSSEHSLPYQDFALSNPNPNYWFSPLKDIGPDEALNTILASQKFEDAFYRALNEKQLGQLISLLHLCNKIDPKKYSQLTVYDIGNILSSSDLREATKSMVALVTSTYPDYSKEDFDTLIHPSKQLQETAIGLGARLTGLYQTQVGRRALKEGEGRKEIDVTIPGLTYIGLDSMGKGEITRLISASVLRRMAVFASDRISGKQPGAGRIENAQPRFLIIDEANFVDKKILLELLSRARSSYITVIVCTQGPSDWESKSGDEVDLESLLQNCNVSFIMSQGSQYNAEICANIIGKENRQDVTQRIDSFGELTESGTIRNVVDHVVTADEIRSLGTGECIVRISRPSVRRFWTQTSMRSSKKNPR